MPYTPQYGATNGAPELDIGQPGSSRRTAQTAFATVTVSLDGDDIRVAQNALPQQNVIFRDLLGFGGKPVVWKATIKCSTRTIVSTIEAELNAYLHGVKYTPGVGYDAFDIARLKPTRLRDGFGEVISDHAILTAWTRGRLMRISEAPYTVIAEWELQFSAVK